MSALVAALVAAFIAVSALGAAPDHSTLCRGGEDATTLNATRDGSCQ